jgi:hypothetical protein
MSPSSISSVILVLALAKDAAASLWKIGNHDILSSQIGNAN